MVEANFPLQDSDVRIAERYRTQGNLDDALRQVAGIHMVRAAEFEALKPFNQKLTLMAARIYVTSYTSLANRANTGPQVANDLENAKNIITRIYKHPVVKEIAQDLKTDTQEAPYDFSAEMTRDEASYLITLANFSGNNSYLEAAKNKLDQVAMLSNEPSAQNLAMFEADLIRHKLEPTPENYYNFFFSYLEATGAAQRNGNWERVATIASRFSIESFKKWHLGRGLMGAMSAVQATLKDRSTRTIYPRQTAKALTESRRYRKWQTTSPAGSDYTHLAI